MEETPREHAGPEVGPEGGPPPSRAARTFARLKRERERGEGVVRDLQDRRRRSSFVDLMFSIGERDRDVYAGTLSGALAFRFFLFLLPWTLMLVALLGFLISRDPQAVADRYGLRSTLAQALVDVTNQGRAHRFWAFLVGLFGAAWASLGAARAVRLAHFLAWDQAPQPLRRAHRAAGAFVLANVVILCAPLVTEWIRGFLGFFGDLVGIMAVFAFYVAFWLVISSRLPHRDVPVRYLVPGAVLIAVGSDVLHVLTVYLFAPRAQHATDVYGVLGVATVLLTWLFVIGRLIIGAAVLNAVLDERRRRRRAHREPVPAGA